VDESARDAGIGMPVTHFPLKQALRHCFAALRLEQSQSQKLDPPMPNIFLTEWTNAYVKADPRDRGRVDVAAALCFDDAKRDGFSRDEVTKAAGGNLCEHLKKAVKSRLM